MLSAQSAQFPSTQSNPSSPTFPSAHSNQLNGKGISLAIRPSATTNNSFSSFAQSPVDSLKPQLNPDSVHAWEDEHVGRWLAEVGAGQHAALFSRNDIRGAVLLDVDQSALKEMGLRSVGDRVRIAVAIKQLRQRAQTSRQQLDNSSPVRSAFNIQHGLDHSARSLGLGRGSGRVPPPLHLTQSNADLPQAYQPSSTRPGATSARSIPPLLPPPRSQPPPAPNGCSPPNQLQSLPRAGGGPPSISTTAASPTAAISSTSGRPPLGLGRNLSGSAYGHSQPLSAHPYASSSSPTQDGFHVPSYGRAPAGGVHAAAGGQKLALLPSPAIPGGSSGLSPVLDGRQQGEPASSFKQIAARAKLTPFTLQLARTPRPTPPAPSPTRPRSTQSCARLSSSSATTA